MKVFVNGKNIRVFNGAKALDAMLSYYKSLHTATPNPMPQIKDRYGNLIEPDGSLSPGIHIFIVESENPNNYE